MADRLERLLQKFKGYNIGVLPPSIPIILFLLLVLVSCAHYPSISEVQLTSGNAKILIHDLYCPVNGNMIAVGNTFGIKSEGVALYSEDQGATWRKATIEPTPVNTQFKLVLIPSRHGTPTLYASGYRNHMFSAEPAPWWTSLDKGRTWGPLEYNLPLSKPRGLVFNNFPKIVVADTTGTLVSAVSESKGVFLLRSDDWGKHWDKRLLQMPRDFASPIISDGHGNLVFFGSSIALHPLDDYIGQVYWSSDAGITWSKSTPPKGHSFLFNMDLYRSPSGKIIAFNSTQRKYGDTIIFHSDDEGRTWKMSSGRGDFGVITGFAGDNKDRIVALTDFGNILLSDDAGASWRNGGRPVTKSLHLRNTPSRIISTGDGIVIATIGNKIARSSDHGDTWTTVESKLPDRVYGFSALCENGKGLIVATGGGMITRSLDWGLTWQSGKME